MSYSDFITVGPPPHYLVVGEWRETEQDLFFVGTVRFPATGEATLEARGHVNVTHHLFAAWNAAHLAVQEGWLPPRPVVISQAGEYLTFAPLDEDLRLEMLVRLQPGDRSVCGLARSTLFQNDGTVVSDHQIRFRAGEV